MDVSLDIKQFKKKLRKGKFLLTQDSYTCQQFQLAHQNNNHIQTKA